MGVGFCGSKTPINDVEDDEDTEEEAVGAPAVGRSGG